MDKPKERLDAHDLARQLAEAQAEIERLALKLKAVEHFKGNYDEMDLSIKNLEQQLTAERQARAEAQVEIERLSEALDANWVTHQQLTAANAEIERLKPFELAVQNGLTKEYHMVKGERDSAREGLLKVVKELRKVKEENESLKKIIETHDICHDLHGKVGRDEFEEGCRRETVKEFGSCGWAEKITEQAKEIARLKEDNAALTKQWNDLDHRNEVRHREWSSQLTADRQAREKAERERDELRREIIAANEELDKLPTEPRKSVDWRSLSLPERIANVCGMWDDDLCALDAENAKLAEAQRKLAKLRNEIARLRSERPEFVRGPAKLPEGRWRAFREWWSEVKVGTDILPDGFPLSSGYIAIRLPDVAEQGKGCGDA